MKKIINGISYSSKPDGDNGCSGCVALANQILCSSINDNDGNECYVNEVIWVKSVDQQTSDITVEDVISAASIVFDLPGMMDDASITRIKGVMRLNKDPEYKEFLRLKNKFEGSL